MGALPLRQSETGEGIRVGRGPYRIVISKFEAPRDPMALGNPAQDRAVSETCRLFGVNVDLAKGILGSVPIVIFTDLDQHTAGVLTKRLMSLVELGCQITTTTFVSDDLPCMNWPELPPIASMEDEPAPRDAPPASHSHAAGLSCPNCGTGLKLVAADDSAPKRRAPSVESKSLPATPPPEPAPEPEPAPVLDEDDGDDWMAQPRSLGPEPSRPSSRRKSTRFDSPALLKASPPPPPPDPLHAGEPQARGVATAVREPDEEDHLRVQLSESSIEELTYSDDKLPTGPSAVDDDFEEPDLGWDSDDGLSTKESTSDIGLDSEPELDLDPIRGPESEDDLEPLGGPSVSDSNGFDGLEGLSDFDDADLIQDSGADFRTSPASTSDVFGSREGRTKPRRGPGRDPFEDSEEDPGADLEDSGSDLLDQTPPHRMTDGGSSRFRSDLDFLDEPSRPSRAFDDLDDLADPPARKPSRKAAAIDPSLSDVLETFGPEDDEPLDSLDPNPPSLGRKDSGRRSPEISDILEPLDPDEALKIMKSKRVDNGRRNPRTSTASNLRLGDDPSSLEPLDPDEAKALLASERQLEESDDDLFGDPPPRSSKSRGARPGTDPFARTRKRKQEEQPRRRKREEPSKSRSRREEPSRARSSKSSRSSKKRDSGRSSRRSGTDAKRSGRKKRSSGPPKGGPGKHGLVLSRILDPDKKEVAAELIMEIRGIPMDDARRLTDRTIIPVLKDVTREEAEFHLDTFKDKQIAGRITTRQR